MYVNKNCIHTLINFYLIYFKLHYYNTFVIVEVLNYQPQFPFSKIKQHSKNNMSTSTLLSVGAKIVQDWLEGIFLPTFGWCGAYRRLLWLALHVLHDPFWTIPTLGLLSWGTIVIIPILELAYSKLYCYQCFYFLFDFNLIKTIKQNPPLPLEGAKWCFVDKFM